MAIRKSELARQIAQKFDIRVLAFDYGILLDLYELGFATAGELRALSRATDTTFFTILKRLEAAGSIESEPDRHDGRRKLYRLSDRTRTSLDEEYSTLPGWIDRKLDGGSTGDDGLSEFFRRTREKLRVRFFSPEFQILLILFEYRTCTTGELKARCDASSTSFYVALKTLVGRELVVPEQTQDDQRIKRYRLTETTINDLVALHLSLRDWVIATLGDPRTLSSGPQAGSASPGS